MDWHFISRSQTFYVSQLPLEESKLDVVLNTGHLFAVILFAVVLIAIVLVPVTLIVVALITVVLITV